MASPKAPGPNNYDHLWKCNQAPTEDEASQIKAAVQALKTAFERVTGRPSAGTLLEAAGVQTPANAAKARKIKEGIRRHEGLLSGVRHIPIEIWQKIFLFSLSDLENQNPYNPYDKELRVLCSVSREWNAVAKGYPTLWVRFPTFEFGPAWAYPSHGKRTSKRLEQYMTLSDRKPFTFGFILHQHMPPESQYLPAANRILKRLVGECHRWKGALIYLAHPEYKGKWPVELARIKGRIPQLSSLNLTVGTNSVPASSKKIAALFSDAPKLRHVVFNTPREAAEGGLLNLELPWSQLETFGGACRANDSFTKLLENTTGNLTSLKCEVNCTPGMPMPIFHTAALPILTTLHLQFTSSQPVMLMMHLIQLPSLEDLKLDGTELNPSLRQPIFMAALRLIARSSCPLKRLRMSFQFPDPPTTAELLNFISLLRACESLTDLDIQTPFLCRTMGELVKPNFPGRVVASALPMPHLRVLTLRSDPKNSEGVVDPRQLLQMLHARAALGNESLEEIRFVHSFNNGSRTWSSQLNLIDASGLPAFGASRLKLADVIGWAAGLRRSFFGPSSFVSDHLNIKRHQTMDASMRKLEDLCLDDCDSRILARRGIVYLLHELSKSEGVIPGDMLFNFRKRAAGLCDKWKPKLLNDYRLSPYRWYRTGNLSASLKYTPPGSNDSDEKLWANILGLDADYLAYRKSEEQWKSETLLNSLVEAYSVLSRNLRDGGII